MDPAATRYARNGDVAIAYQVAGDGRSTSSTFRAGFLTSS